MHNIYYIIYEPSRLPKILNIVHYYKGVELNILLMSLKVLRYLII